MPGISRQSPGQVVILTLLAMLAPCFVQAGAVRELVDIQGAVPITLEGVGIVTGLANTGDSKGAALELLRKYLRNINFDFDTASLASGNIALVRVTAELPPFGRPGQNFPVGVTSLNGAKSLAGGELLACDLFDGVSEEPVARATGQVMVGTGILTRGTIPDGRNSGARQLAVYPFGNVVNREGIVRLNLRRANWADATGIARQINQSPALNPYLQETSMFAETGEARPVAYAKDAGQVLVRIPDLYRNDTTRYISNVLEVPVSVDQPARILVNRARNSIVVTGDIQVNNAMISLQDKTVTIRPETEDEPPAYVLDPATPRSAVEVEGPGTYADLQGLIDTMNAMGMSTEQVITVFEQLREAGAIKADLINQ
ncbi:MAG: flagellar basal body P-ring protein FlgI [Planctomycetota bacterium]|jgi:flagellar P-ring protein precursor FlgI|nr:flagellar basal body P-ring protein FlgI [Planctomycetota bacterium]